MSVQSYLDCFPYPVGVTVNQSLLDYQGVVYQTYFTGAEAVADGGGNWVLTLANVPMIPHMVHVVLNGGVQGEDSAGPQHNYTVVGDEVRLHFQPQASDQIHVWYVRTNYDVPLAVTITSSAGASTPTTPIPFRIEFTDIVEGFSEDNINVVGGTIDDLVITTEDGITVATFNVDSDLGTEVTVNVIGLGTDISSTTASCTYEHVFVGAGTEVELQRLDFTNVGAGGTLTFASNDPSYVPPANPAFVSYELGDYSGPGGAWVALPGNGTLWGVDVNGGSGVLQSGTAVNTVTLWRKEKVTPVAPPESKPANCYFRVYDTVALVEGAFAITFEHAEVRLLMYTSSEAETSVPTWWTYPQTTNVKCQYQNSGGTWTTLLPANHVTGTMGNMRWNLALVTKCLPTMSIVQGQPMGFSFNAVTGVGTASVSVTPGVAIGPLSTGGVYTMSAADTGDTSGGTPGFDTAAAVTYALYSQATFVRTPASTDVDAASPIYLQSGVGMSEIVAGRYNQLAYQVAFPSDPYVILSYVNGGTQWWYVYPGKTGYPDPGGALWAPGVTTTWWKHNTWPSGHKMVLTQQY